jgi:hypothetical protein
MARRRVAGDAGGATTQRNRVDVSLDGQSWTPPRHAHHAVGLAMDGQGLLHPDSGYQRPPLKYGRTFRSGSLKLAEDMVGKNEDLMTYPEFHQVTGSEFGIRPAHRAADQESTRAAATRSSRGGMTASRAASVRSLFQGLCF